MYPSYRWPAEWSRQQAYWTAYPDKPQLWGSLLNQAQRESLALIQQLTTCCPQVHVLVPPEPVGDRTCWAQLQALPIVRHKQLYGDIWLRDTGAIFVTHQGRHIALCFQHNGWGHKYHLAYDHHISHFMAQQMDCEPILLPWVVEGGALEINESGLLLTTSTCLLDEQRNGPSRQSALHQVFQRYLGCQEIIWLEGQLLHDHTDGHIDTLVRWLPNNRVLCMLPISKDDPNGEMMHRLHQQLQEHPTLCRQGTTIETVCSPGQIMDTDGSILPASYLNYLVANQSVLVPTYGSPNDTIALRQLTRLWPNHRIVPLSALALLSGGGALHCMSQQYPAIETTWRVS